MARWDAQAPDTAMKAKPSEPLADVWDTNLEAVLSALVTDGVRRISLELATAPDGKGNVRLLVRRMADAKFPTLGNLPDVKTDTMSDMPPTAKPASRADGACLFRAMREATQP